MTMRMSDSITRTGEALQYAILSHRWGLEEVTFQDFHNGNAQGKQGWQKVKSFCSFIKWRGYRYGWVDTCCIDKTSSAELSEAINSMFSWYQRAKICFVYLEDVAGNDLSCGTSLEAFQKSDWFTRGWTLQELLAPESLTFVNQKWEVIGTRKDLASEVSKITGIPTMQVQRFRRRALTHNHWVVEDPSVADILSWAAHRSTSREEDQAYSLVGLFGVYMAPIYGEGQNAFRRLQVQIIESCEDDTIFTWDSSSITGDSSFDVPRLGYSSLLAPHIRYFANCHYSQYFLTRWDDDPRERRMTNKGLRVEKLLRPLEDDDTKLLMPLNSGNRNIGGWRIEPSKLCAAVIIVKHWVTGNYFRCGGSAGHVLEHNLSDRDGFTRQIMYSS